MIKCIKTDSDNEDFRRLVRELDADLKRRDGEEHTFYSQFNKIDHIKHVVVAYVNNEAVGCGAIKAYMPDAVEVKRMYVQPGKRGQGIASTLLKALEAWTVELRYTKCVLETGKKQPEAIGLYHKNGYTVIPNYGQYENVENSVCFEKIME
jgi:GNAT superfamily N-acetyltransferase